MQLIYTINKVTKDGKELSFTNFQLVIQVNGKDVYVPIQPVNFGEKSNRFNYSVLKMSALSKNEYEERKKQTMEAMPF